MRKQAVSITLDRQNLLWLRGQARLRGRRSLSETVDRLVTDARSRRVEASGEPLPTVVGLVEIPESDPDLRGSDAAIRALFGIGAKGLSRAQRRSPRRRRG